jgi:hypothetical protein
MSVLNCEVLHIPDGVHIVSFSHAQPCPCHGYPRSTVGGDAVSGAQARLEAVRAYACRADPVRRDGVWVQGQAQSRCGPTYDIIDDTHRASPRRVSLRMAHQPRWLNRAYQPLSVVGNSVGLRAAE